MSLSVRSTSEKLAMPKTPASRALTSSAGTSWLKFSSSRDEALRISLSPNPRNAVLMFLFRWSTKYARLPRFRAISWYLTRAERISER